MTETENNDIGWWAKIKNSVSNTVDKIKQKTRSEPVAQPVSTPVATTNSTVGGSKKRRGKKTKRVRFSKRNKVYKYKATRRTKRK
jgi:hypothetical protein